MGEMRFRRAALWSAATTVANSTTCDYVAVFDRVPFQEWPVNDGALDTLLPSVQDAKRYRVMAVTVSVVQLQPETLDAFLVYVRDAEAAMQPSLDGNAPFLWSDESPERARRVRQGDTPARLWAGSSPVRVPDGFIHDWIGAALIPNTTLAKTLARVQDYDHHKDIYKPEVTESRLLSHHGGDFTIFLRLLKKKIITVVMDTEHDVHYQHINSTECFCRSYTGRNTRLS